MSKQIEEVMALVDELVSNSISGGVCSIATNTDVAKQAQDYAKAITALRSSMESKLRELLPEGFVLVPVLPTETMLKAAVMNAEGDAVYKSLEERWLKEEEQKYGDVYCAMLSAAPKTPE